MKTSPLKCIPTNLEIQLFGSARADRRAMVRCAQSGDKVTALFPAGMEIHGFEVKVSRGDWLRERKQPGKAEPFFRYCDRWWLVIGDKAIVQEGELPPTWGLLAPGKRGLATVTNAPKLEPLALDRPFFAALARRSAEVPAATIEALIHKRVAEVNERNAQHRETNEKRHQEALAEIHRKIKEFEDASGVSIRERWPKTAGNIGEAVRFVLAGGMKTLENELASIQQQAENLARRVKQIR